MLIGIVIGIATGIISGLIVTIYYREKDAEKERIAYYESLLQHAMFLCRVFMPLSLLGKNYNDLVSLFEQITFPHRFIRTKQG